jgi:hypothetical protein
MLTTIQTNKNEVTICGDAVVDSGDGRLLYNAQETMQALGLVRRRQLYHLLYRGMLKKHPAFRTLMFLKSDVEKFAIMR